MKKNQFFAKGFLLVLFPLSLININVQAQTPGTWQSSSAQTKTGNAVGIGTNTPAGWEEISYCNTNQKGLIITNTTCGTYLAKPVTFDGEVEMGAWLAPGAEGGTTGKKAYYPVADYTLKPFGAFSGSAPMIWARAENSDQNGAFTGSYSSRFIVTPMGTSGVNIEVPRATFDIKSLGGDNYPGLLVGRQATNIGGVTQHMMFIPRLSAGGYNHISQTGDQGMFFTDGKGAAGSNQNGAFVLAPWSNDNSKGGLRMDKDGNVELRGNLKTTKVTVKATWWPDFVFSEAYKRMSLYELEKYIAENKHLPEVSSETEIMENGISVHEQIAIHLQKIEELTLYTIEQQKEIDELTKLKSEMELLKEQIETLINK